jgi:hypothetical protein
MLRLSERVVSVRPVLGGLFAVVLALGVGACGGDDDKDTGASATPTTAASNGEDGGGTETTVPDDASSSDLPSDACALLHADDVEAVLGVAAVAKPSDRSGSGGGGPQVKGCQWGEVAADSGVVAVQISKPDPETGIDYVKSVVNASGGGGTPVDIGENGQLIPRAHIPYGGGVGLSVMFTHNGNTVVIGATKASEAQTKAAAEKVLENLNS